MSFGGFRSVWIMVMFDLPTDTKTARRSYQNFRKILLENGFLMLQFSIYARPCPSEDNSKVHFIKIKNNLPPEGEVRILQITDKQYERTQIFQGKSRKPTEPTPLQLTFF